MRGRSRLIIAIVAVVAVALLTFFFLVNPKRGDLSDLRELRTEEEARTLALSSELTRLEGLRDNAPQLERQLAVLRQSVPEGHQIPNFIFLVQEAANKSGVGFVQITPELPASPPEGAAVAQVQVTIGASGGYFAIQDFMRRLYNLDRALRADSLSLTPAAAAEGAAPDITFAMTARIFFALPEGVVPTGTTTTPAPGTTPEPGATPTAEATPTP